MTRQTRRCRTGRSFSSALYYVCGNTFFSKQRTVSSFTPLPLSQAKVAPVPHPRIGASIYYPDGSTGHDDASATDADEVYGPLSPRIGCGSLGAFGPLSSAGEVLFGNLARRLSSDPAVASALARLASAFSPAEFAIDLASVNNVRCLSVDNTHLEIEALVCDDQECSSLLVPVDFPETCDVDVGLEECILRNISNLNDQGQNLLQERGQVFAEEQEAQRAYEALQSHNSEYLKSAPESLPPWWKPPSSADEVAECNLIKQLLNGDEFGDMLRGLAEYAMLHNGEDMVGRAIRTVRVKAVGQAGIVLKAQISIGGRTYEDDGGLNNEIITYVPIRYNDILPAYQRSWKRTIREEVLLMVSSVNTA